jgi:hypothetical protein
LVLLAGCASDKPSYVHGSGSHQMAAIPHKVEIEDDGQPVQPPPARAMRPEEDDPSQPWSPNYGQGGAPAVPSAPARAVSPQLPKQVDAYIPAPTPATYQPAVTSTGSLTRLSDNEADAVIARAINAHEMRRQ